MDHPLYELRPSPIAGLGLFAITDIPAGTVVLPMDPGVVSAAAPGGPGNHSCEPNLWWADDRTLVARRDIAAGEELTDDYATSTDDPGFMLRCNCPSTRCRQMVTGDDWRIPQLQRWYDGHWTSWVAARLDDGNGPQAS